MSNYRRPPTQPSTANGLAAFGSLQGSVPVGAFSASVLFDVLALVADGPQQANSYRHGAAELLTLGLGSALASIGLELVDDLREPEKASGPLAAQRLALNGAIVAVYLLDVAARRTGAGSSEPGRDVVPTALSLLGLLLLGISGKRT